MSSDSPSSASPSFETPQPAASAATQVQEALPTHSQPAHSQSTHSPPTHSQPTHSQSTHSQPVQPRQVHAFVHAPESLEALRQLGNSAPVAQALGMVIQTVEPGRAVVVLPYQRHILQAHGRVHGGLFGLLADTAGYFAAASVQPGDGVTIEYKLNLLEGVKDQGLIAEARVVKTGRSISLCDVEVFSDDGVLVGKALATYRFFQHAPPRHLQPST